MDGDGRGGDAAPVVAHDDGVVAVVKGAVDLRYDQGCPGGARDWLSVAVPLISQVLALRGARKGDRLPAEDQTRCLRGGGDLGPKVF